MLTVILEKLGRLGESHEALTRRVEELEVKTKRKKKITCVSAKPTDPNFLCLP
jgi:hypothetical protein